MATSNSGVFVVGRKFHTFSDLQAEIRQWEQENYIDLWRRDSRSIAAARKRGIGVVNPIKPDLLYYEVRYCCIYGGQAFKSRTTGIRQTSTFRKDCPFTINLRVTRDGQTLEVTKVMLHHNHPISKELFQHLPRQRKLPEEVKQRALQMLDVDDAHPKNESSRSSLKEESRHIQNYGRKRASSSALQEVISLLRSEHSATVDMACEKDHSVVGLFLQDCHMKFIFDAYPEILYVDILQDQVDVSFSLYVFYVEDGNGQLEIAALCVILRENQNSVSWMMETFKKFNSKWEHICVVLVDRQFLRTVLKICFPQACLLQSVYHTLNSFRKDITETKLNITSSEILYTIDILKKMAFCKTEDEYTLLHDKLKKSGPLSVVNYFNENWHPQKQEWVLGSKFSTGNFLSSTNSYSDTVISSVKYAVSKSTTLEKFLCKLFVVVNTVRKEFNVKCDQAKQKLLLNQDELDANELDFVDSFTTYGAKIVLDQYQQSAYIPQVGLTSPAIFKIESDEGTVDVTDCRCSCTFWYCMNMPCRHIFALRRCLELPITEEFLYSRRWTNVYYSDKHMSNRNSHIIEVGPSSEINSKKLQWHEMHMVASQLTAHLTALTAQGNHLQFEKRLHVLNEILSCWESGQEVEVCPLDGSTMDGDIPDGCILPSELLEVTVSVGS